MEVFALSDKSKKIAIGRIFFLSNRIIKNEIIDDVNAQTEAFDKAVIVAKKQLEDIASSSVSKLGKESAAIFEAQSIILEDAGFQNMVRSFIANEKISAASAVSKAGEKYAQMFLGLGDELISARATDVRDVSARLISVLEGKSQEISYDFGSGEVCDDGGCILAAKELFPSDLILLDKNKIEGIIVEEASDSSHVAILARGMEIPFVGGVKVCEAWHGKKAIISDCLYIDPDSDVLERYQREKTIEDNCLENLEEFVSKRAITKDGKELELLANISGIEEAVLALEKGAAGVGLFRTEYLFMASKTLPTEDEQFECYKGIAQKMGNKKVIIRTLDLGADKRAECLELDAEDNPAMGYRAIRICLDRTDIFKTQLRAIYRASAFGNISVMFPMIVSLEEIKQIKTICKEVCDELKASGVTFKNIPMGIIIETPAAVMISDLLAEEVDFFSIGTNDLTQFSLAVDRQNPRLNKMFDSHNEAIMRMIQLVIQNGHRYGCKVGMCGELAADISMTRRLIEMGIDELSVSPSHILPVKKAIIEMKL